MTSKAFLQVIADRSNKIHDIINSKENEIRELQERLKRYLSSSQDTYFTRPKVL